MENWKIKKNVLLSIMELSKSSFPNEFSGMLVGDKDKKLIDDIYIIPATQNHRNSSSIRLDLVPMSFSIIGTVHSHPSGLAHPSRADLNFFQSKSVNIITNYPFGLKDFKVYDNSGNDIFLEIIWFSLKTTLKKQSLIKAMAKSIYFFCNTILLEQEIATFSLPELLKQKF